MIRTKTRSFKSCELNKTKKRYRQIDILYKCMYKKNSNEYKEYLIRKALSTKEGREALAQVMTNPVRCGGRPC